MRITIFPADSLPLLYPENHFSNNFAFTNHFAGVGAKKIIDTGVDAYEYVQSIDWKEEAIGAAVDLGVGLYKLKTMNSEGVSQADAPALAATYADTFRAYPKKDRPATVAVIMTYNGDVVYGYSQQGIYCGIVQKDLDEIGIAGQYNWQCAEINAISQAVEAELDLVGAVIAVVKVRGLDSTSGDHGVPFTPCEACGPLISRYGMFYISN